MCLISVQLKALECSLNHAGENGGFCLLVINNSLKMNLILFLISHIS